MPADDPVPRWRWGRCPRCHADAWIEVAHPRNVACAKQCGGFSIWSYLEAEYRWQQRYGALFGLHSFNDDGRMSEQCRRQDSNL